MRPETCHSYKQARNKLWRALCCWTSFLDAGRLHDQLRALRFASKLSVLCCSSHSLFYYIVPVYKPQVWSFTCSRQCISEISPIWTESVISEDFSEIWSKPSHQESCRVNGRSPSCFARFQMDQQKDHRVSNKTRIWALFKVSLSLSTYSKMDSKNGSLNMLRYNLI